MAVSANTQSRVTEDTDVTTVSSVLRSVTLTPDGTNACSVIIKDGTAAAGTAKLSLATAGTGPSVVWTGSALYASGIGVDVTGTGVAVSVEYDQN
jgi:hypothetical protein